MQIFYVFFCVVYYFTFQAVSPRLRYSEFRQLCSVIFKRSWKWTGSFSLWQYICCNWNFILYIVLKVIFEFGMSFFTLLSKFCICFNTKPSWMKKVSFAIFFNMMSYFTSRKESCLYLNVENTVVFSNMLSEVVQYRITTSICHLYFHFKTWIVPNSNCILFRVQIIPFFFCRLAWNKKRIYSVT